MDIIDINYEKLRCNINKYILDNNENIFMCPDEHITYDRPIILMNEKTFKFLYEKNTNYINNCKRKTETFPMIFGCHIAFANWLPFGEVELK